MSDLGQARRDPKFIASAVLVALIVLAGIVLASIYAFGGDDDTRGTAPEPTSTHSSGQASSTCGLPDGDQTVPTTAPPTKWYFKGKVAVPASSTIGPAKGRGDNTVAACFAHSPAGALFSAATIAAETSSFSSVAKEAVLAHILPGDLRDQLISELDPTPGPLAQIVGFKFEDHTPDRSTVTLASRLVDGPNAGAIGATPMTLVWKDGDWHQELQPSSTTVVITSLDGFVPWSGIS